MACLRPIQIRNKRYQKLLQTPSQYFAYLKETIGYQNCIINTTDPKEPYYLPPDYYINVPCGKCAECRKHKRLSWSFRLMQEQKQYKSSAFLTLTLDDKSLKRFAKNPDKPIKLFIDRLRKHLGFRPRYFFVSEYGETTDRLHFHGIIFGTDRKSLPFDLLRGKWQYGHVWIAEFCDFRTANYITKYMLKDSNGKKPILLCSNGIGLRYVTPITTNTFINNFDFKTTVQVGRTFYPLHRYYQDKMLNDDLRLCRMLNARFGIQKPNLVFNKIQYNSQYEYLKARSEWYDFTLKTKLSYGIYNSRTRKNRGFFFESSSTDFESWHIRPRHSYPCVVQGCITWR